MSYASRAVRGAALLDERIPDWDEKIDISKLDLGDGNKCILGQLFNCGYDQGYNLMFPDALSDKQAMKWAQRHGYTNRNHNKEKYSSLTREWRRILYLRQEVREMRKEMELKSPPPQGTLRVF